LGCGSFKKKTSLFPMFAEQTMHAAFTCRFCVQSASIADCEPVDCFSNKLPG